MVRHLAANGLNLLIMALVFVAGLIGWGVNSYRAPGPLAEARIVEVPRNSSLTKVADRLLAEGVIRNATVFRLGVRYAGLDGAMKFGVYEVPAGASMADVATLLTEGGARARYLVTFGLRADGVQVRIADLLKPEAAPEEPDLAAVLASGSSAEFRVTVPEGLTSWQIVEGLKAVGELGGEIAAVPAEGSLAPDTYSFDRGAARQSILDRMAAAQARILAAAWAARQPGLPLESAEEALILASIVEKETGIAAERPIVASVFINRLNRGMRLETDPTVIYGLTGGRAPLDRELTRSDLQKRTAYNTYRIEGLPPTPIANPGRAAIEAVLAPAATDYIFFVADGTGGHAFAANKADHDANVRRWRQIEEERKRAAEAAAPAQP